MANQVTLGGEQKNKEISELALRVAELIKEAKAEKAKANVARANAEKAKANAQKKVKGKNAGSQTNATETNSWNETRAKQEFNKLNNGVKTFNKKMTSKLPRIRTKERMMTRRNVIMKLGGKTKTKSTNTKPKATSNTRVQRMLASMSRKPPLHPNLKTKR